jgi:hypothetical protein
VEESGATISSEAEVATSDHLASELSKMAENDSDLAKEVDARLRGAKVRFDGTSPTIETQPESGTPTPQRASSPSDPARPASHERGRTPAGHASVAPARNGPTAHPVRSATADQARDQDWARELAREQAENAAPARRPRYAHAGKVVRAIPFVLIFMFLVLGFDRTVSLFGALFGLTFGVLVVVALIVATSRVGRKTTSMPRDDTLGSSSRRRLP